MTQISIGLFPSDSLEEGVDFSKYFDYQHTDSEPKANTFTFLAKATPEEWAQIGEQSSLIRYSKGETVVKKGETRQSFFIVLKGELEVLTVGKWGKVHQLALIQGGSVFGEQSFIDGAPRSADVRGCADGEVLEMTMDTFNVLAAQNPKLARDIVFDLARVLSLRLRLTTSALVQLKK